MQNPTMDVNSGATSEAKSPAIEEFYENPEFVEKLEILEKFGFSRNDPAVMRTLVGLFDSGGFHRYRTNCFQTQEDRINSHAARIKRARSVSYNHENDQLNLQEIQTYIEKNLVLH